MCTEVVFNDYSHKHIAIATKPPAGRQPASLALLWRTFGRQRRSKVLPAGCLTSCASLPPWRLWQWVTSLTQANRLNLDCAAAFCACCTLNSQPMPQSSICSPRLVSGMAPTLQGGSSKRNKKKLFTLLDLCVSSLRRGHANLLCIVPILTDDPRRESRVQVRKAVRYSHRLLQPSRC